MQSRGLIGGIAVVIACIVAIPLLGWLVSIKGTDTGEICVVREGGPFDGRDIKEVRQPGEGPKPIGALNHQDCLPTTERDSNDVIEDQDKEKDGNQLPSFPTKDSVQVIADGQALFNLTTDPAKILTFYKKYGRRKWGGEDITDDKGWLNFLRQRFQPVILDVQREVLGQYECIALNNLCQYVQNAQAAANGEVKKADTTQNLSAAQAAIANKLRQRLRAAFGDDYFENVRYQNLRIRFEDEVKARVTEAQSLRTQAANAKLEAQRKVAEAKGDADRRVEVAKGERAAASEQEKTYRLNPTKRQIDRIKAFCGSEGCNPQVIGNSGKVIANLGRGE